MNNQTFFLIVIVIILIYYLPSKNDVNNKYTPQPQVQPQTFGFFDSIMQLILPFEQSISSTTTIPQINPNPNSSSSSQNIINEYLNENECKEKFDTMGLNIDIGNNMNFKQESIQNPSLLSKALSKSLVPDFEPNHLNINPDLNSFGYATINPQADKYYESRGFIEPQKGQEFADSVSYMLSHPYQTRYCKK